MKTLLRTFLLAVVLTTSARAQITFTVVDTDGSNYPDVKVRFETKDAANKYILDYAPSDFTVVENGIPRPVISVSCPPPLTPVMSMTLTFDISFSMSIDNRLPNLKAASTQLIQDMSLPPAGVGINTFSDAPAVRLQYTSDKAAVLASIDSLRASGGGTDFLTAFMDPTAGSIAFTANRPGARYIIFMTDAFESMTTAQENQIINAARAANIKVFTVSLSPNTINMNLRRIATQTGGAWFEDVTTADKAKAIFKQIGEQIFQYLPCELIYRTDGCDTERMVEVTIRKNNRTVTRSATVSVPANKIVSLDAPAPLIDYGAVPAGQTLNKDIVIAARNGSITVQSISSPESGFRILDYGGTAPPFTLTAGQTRSIRVQYRPVTTDRLNARLVIVSDAPCQETITLTGGVYDPAPLKLIAPNGGEKLFSGGMFRSTWTGISATTPAELLYSTDAGDTWMRISDNVYNYGYNWRVPNTPSTTCLGLVTTKEERITQLDAGWSMQQPSTITAIAVAHSGTLTALALQNGQIKLFYPKDGAFVTILAGHSGGTSDLAFSPDMHQLASSGADGTVKIWDMQTGALLRTLTGLSGDVHSVRYSLDGSLLAASNASTVILWQTNNWGERWRHNGDSGADGGIAIDPRNAWVASTAGNRIAILDIANGNRVQNLTGHGGPVRAIDISHEGSVLASASDDRTVRLWNTITWSQIMSLTGHTDAVRSVQLTNAGVRVISGSRDHTVRIWDGRDGTLKYTLQGHSDDVLAAVVDHRIKYVLSGGSDRGLRIWGYVPPLADKSDSLWTIITTVTSLDYEMEPFEALQCPDTWSDSEVVLRNIGNQVVNITGMTIDGQDKDLFSVRDGFTIPPTVTLQPEDTLAIPLRFFPTRTGSFTAELVFETNIPGSPQFAIPLTGHKDSIRLEIDPDTLFAGEMYQCSEAVYLPVVLTNAGTATIVADSMASSMGGAISFSGMLSRILLPGQSDTVLVRVAPVVDGDFEGVLTVDVTPCAFTHDIVVTGRRLTARPVASPNPLDLGFAAIGDQTNGTLTLSNPTQVDMVIDSTALLLPSPPFTLLNPPDTAFVLPAGGSVQFNFTYAPQSEGDSQGQVFFHANAPCLDSILVDIRGSSSRKPAITHQIGTFAELLCPGDTISTTSAVLRNTGGLPLTISDLQITGTHAGDFHILWPTPPVTVQPNDTTTVLLSFVPRGLRTPRTASLLVTSNALNTPALSIPLSGLKQDVRLEVQAADRDHGVVYACNLPVYDTLWYRNPGTVPLNMTLDATLLPSGASIDPPNTTFTLQPGAERRIVLRLEPGAYGTLAATLRAVPSPCLGPVQHTYSVTLSPHVAQVQPTALDFGTLGVGFAQTRSFTIRNPWSHPMQLGFGGNGLSEMSQVLPQPLPTVIPPGDSVTITLEYSRAVAHTLSASIRVYTTVQGCEDSSHVVTLSGRVQGSVATVSVPALQAAVGEHITIPLRLTNSSNLALTGTKSFRALLALNRTVFWPESISSSTGTATMTLDNVGPDVLWITVEVTQAASPSDGVLVELRGLVLLGNTDSTPLMLMNFDWLEGNTQTTRVNGSLLVTGICEEGGKRLLAAPSLAKIAAVSPNPFNGSTDIVVDIAEETAVELRIYSLIGMEVAAPFTGTLAAGTHRLPFDAGALPSGSYVVMLRSPEGVSTMRVVLSR